MSFGYGIGDVIAVGTLAWTLYKALTDAPDAFHHIHTEVLSLHVVLKEAEETICKISLDPRSQKGLATVIGGCNEVLLELQALVVRYDSLNAQSKRAWDRVRWCKEDIAGLRDRLNSNVNLLTAFISTSQAAVLQKLNNFLKAQGTGSNRNSIVSHRTLDSLNSDDRQAWRHIRKDLEEIGITVEAFDLNHDLIIDWFKRSLEAGDFEEQVVNQNKIYAGGQKSQSSSPMNIRRSSFGRQSNASSTTSLAESLASSMSSGSFIASFGVLSATIPDDTAPFSRISSAPSVGILFQHVRGTDPDHFIARCDISPVSSFRPYLPFTEINAMANDMTGLPTTILRQIKNIIDAGRFGNTSSAYLKSPGSSLICDIRKEQSQIRSWFSGSPCLTTFQVIFSGIHGEQEPQIVFKRYHGASDTFEATVRELLTHLSAQNFGNGPL